MAAISVPMGTAAVRPGTTLSAPDRCWRATLPTPRSSVGPTLAHRSSRRLRFLERPCRDPGRLPRAAGGAVSPEPVCHDMERESTDGPDRSAIGVPNGTRGFTVTPSNNFLRSRPALIEHCSRWRREGADKPCTLRQAVHVNGYDRISFSLVSAPSHLREKASFRGLEADRSICGPCFPVQNGRAQLCLRGKRAGPPRPPIPVPPAGSVHP